MSQLTKIKRAEAKLEAERQELAIRQKLLMREKRKLSASVAHATECLVGRAVLELAMTGQPVDPATLIATATLLARISEADALTELIDRLKPPAADQTGTGLESAHPPSANPECVSSPPLDAEDSGSLAPKPQPVAATAPAPLPSRRQFGTSLQNSSSAAAPPELEGAGVGNPKT